MHALTTQILSLTLIALSPLAAMGATPLAAAPLAAEPFHDSALDTVAPLETAASEEELAELETLLDAAEPPMMESGNYRRPADLAQGTAAPATAGKNTALYQAIDGRVITDELELQSSDVEYDFEVTE